MDLPAVLFPRAGSTHGMVLGMNFPHRNDESREWSYACESLQRFTERSWPGDRFFAGIRPFRAILLSWSRIRRRLLAVRDAGKRSKIPIV